METFSKNNRLVSALKTLKISSLQAQKYKLKTSDSRRLAIPCCYRPHTTWRNRRKMSSSCCPCLPNLKIVLKSNSFARFCTIENTQQVIDASK